MSSATSEKNLVKHFERIGLTVVKCEIMLNPVTKESRRFGFVTFASAQDANRAIEEMHLSNLHGSSISVKPSDRSGGRQKTPGVYMGPR